MWDFIQIPRDADTQAAEIQNNPVCVQTVVLLCSHQKGLEKPATQCSGQRHPKHICVNSAQVIPKPKLFPPHARPPVQWQSNQLVDFGSSL